MPYQIVSNTNDLTLRVNGQDALVVNKNGLITTPITVRQTVELGTVDSSGFSAFGGSTGSTTVTTATTLYLNAANGMVNRRGSITNPSWTGLSTNGTMYLYLDIAADGTCTSGSGTLAPVYQHGGTYSTTSGQFTFNIQEMQGKVGNGSSAVQTYRVYVGEVVVSGGVVASIIWYALNGRYDSGYTATLPTAATVISKSSNMGCVPLISELLVKCTTIDAGYAVGDVLKSIGAYYTVGQSTAAQVTATANIVSTVSGNYSNGWTVLAKTTGINTATTNASWSYKLTAQRGW